MPRLLDEQLLAALCERSLRGLLRVPPLSRASRLLGAAPRRLVRLPRRRRARRRRLLGFARRHLRRPRLARARLFLGAFRARLLFLGAARLGRLALLGEEALLLGHRFVRGEVGGEPLEPLAHRRRRRPLERGDGGVARGGGAREVRARGGFGARALHGFHLQVQLREALLRQNQRGREPERDARHRTRQRVRDSRNERASVGDPRLQVGFAPSPIRPRAPQIRGPVLRLCHLDVLAVGAAGALEYAQLDPQTLRGLAHGGDFDLLQKRPAPRQLLHASLARVDDARATLVRRALGVGGARARELRGNLPLRLRLARRRLALLLRLLRAVA